MSFADPADAVRYAARVVDAPAGAVAGWRALTGCKAVGCSPPIPVPEILHAAGLLPVTWHSPGIPPGLSRCIDAWVIDPEEPARMPIEAGTRRFVFPATPPAETPDAMDLLEALAEWAGALSGHPVTEGGLGKSLRAFRERRELLSLLRKTCDTETGFLSAGEMRNLCRAGDYLPPEAHSLLLALVLDIRHSPRAPIGEEERADPLLALVRRMTIGPGGRGGAEFFR